MNALVAVAAAVVTTLAGSGFSAIEEHDGVKVYRRDPTRGIELGAEGVLDAPPAAVLAVLRDYPNSGRWVDRVRESRVLASGPSALDVYQRLDLPVLDDRDFTLHVTWGQQGDALWLAFTTANDRGPAPRDGVVRVSTHEGSWWLTPVDGGRRTRAVYRFHLDLAGSVPGWLGRGRAGKDIPRLFRRLEGEARHRTEHAAATADR
jgi:hypothetical protein